MNAITSKYKIIIFQVILLKICILKYIHKHNMTSLADLDELKQQRFGITRSCATCQNFSGRMFIRICLINIK